MKTKSKITVVAVVGIFVGYALGTAIAWPNASGNLGSGDISKVSKFHKSEVGSQTSALEEKLRSDTLAFNQESSMVALINSRMTNFADLVDYAIIAASDKDEFDKEVKSLINVRELSDNAVQAGKIAAASLEYLESGEKNELVTDYEKASQDLVVAFMMVDRQVRLGKQFVSAADEYLDGKSLDDVPEIALVRDLWAEYCAESAWLNEDRQEMKYWEEKTTIASSDIIAKGIQTLGILEGAQDVIKDKVQGKLVIGIIEGAKALKADELLESIQNTPLDNHYKEDRLKALFGLGNEDRDGMLGLIAALSNEDRDGKLGMCVALANEDLDGRLGYIQGDMQKFIVDRGSKSIESAYGKDENNTIDLKYQ